MAKKFHAPRLEGVQPQGPITVAAAPIAVQARVRWIIAVPEDWTVINDAWVMAWTKTDVLVAWVTADMVTSVWIPASHVRRR